MFCVEGCFRHVGFTVLFRLLCEGVGPPTLSFVVL